MTTTDAPGERDHGKRPRRPGRSSADHALALALVGGATAAEAAKRAGVSESTVSRRLRQPYFQALLAELRKEQTARTLAVLSDASVEAARSLAEMTRPTVPLVVEPGHVAVHHSVRVAASKAVLELAGKMRSELVVEQRIARVEAALGLAAGASGLGAALAVPAAEAGDHDEHEGEQRE